MKIKNNLSLLIILFLVVVESHAQSLQPPPPMPPPQPAPITDWPLLLIVGTVIGYKLIRSIRPYKEIDIEEL